MGYWMTKPGHSVFKKRFPSLRTVEISVRYYHRAAESIMLLIFVIVMSVGKGVQKNREDDALASALARPAEGLQSTAQLLLIAVTTHHDLHSTSR